MSTAPRHASSIGVPLDLGGGRRGVDMGPSAVRIAGLGERLAAMGCTVVDKGDLAAPIPETQSRARPAQEVRARNRAGLPEAVSAGLSVARGWRHCPSCSAAITRSPPVRSARRPILPPPTASEIGLLWVDAHGDMNTPATTTTGNVHGMPLAALLGPEPAELSQIGARSPKVRADKTVLIGMRNLDDSRRQAILDARVHVFTMKDIDRDGIATVMERALAIAGTRHRAASTCRSIWTSAIPSSRPASARRSKAASTTAKRTW